MLFPSLPLAAQTQGGSLRGVVRDKEFDAPLAAAQVLLVETGQKATTGEEGNFVFPQVAAGKYTLVFTKEGYLRQVIPDVLVKPGELTDLEVVLAGEFVDLEEFLVQDLLAFAAGSEAGLLALRFESPALMDSIGSDLIRRAGASDAASALRLVAGASLQDGKSAVIRGLPDRYVNSQMNGVRLPTADEDKRAVELDQFPAAVIESIQVSKTFTPDQQGDASGGAVNLRLKGIPDEPFFLKLSTQSSFNTNVAGSDFLSYHNGGVSFFGYDDGGRDIQHGNIGSSWDGAVGVSRGGPPNDSKWGLSVGGKREFEDGVKIGGLVSLFYERDSSFYDDGKDDSRWIVTPGSPMTPQYSQGTPSQGDFKTSLYDVTQGSQLVRWGALGALGLETENHKIGLSYLFTHSAEDKATLAEDTRGKKFFFPGYDPADPTTPGHDQPQAAPYLRTETLEYTERTTETLQLSGKHKLPIEEWWIFRRPELDWLLADSLSSLDQPDKRQFGTLWIPQQDFGPIVLPAVHLPYKPAANFNLGNLQRIWKTIEEDSQTVSANLKFPYVGLAETEGYLKVGIFHDSLDRTFDQNTFSNFGDNSFFNGEFNQFWSRVFPSETNHPITPSTFDVDYDGDQTIAARYAMLDFPLASTLRLIGGVRYETTKLSIVNHPERDATWFPPGASAPVDLNPGDADVSFSQNDLLPSIGLEWKPVEPVTFRASYNETIARQTFKELTPILQQEYLGGEIFVGNPELRMSRLKNYDLRLDYAPHTGGLLSGSWFRKTIDDPIEYVQRLATFNFTTPVNYPKGKLHGFEIEGRETLGRYWDALEGLGVGANATFIDAEVTLSDEEADTFNAPNIQAPMKTRDMTNAPDHLYNLYLTYDLASTGTQVGLFYTVQGDTLVAGAGASTGNLVPNVYAKEFDTLNFTLLQKLGQYLHLQFQAKNLTNPRIETVYRS
ncbi:MAG TPA: TonB-dependent receptor, partial [Planctomycetota bacterium]|nr:TonB-dependent receptor [Planctomycetota bacterium]